MFLQCPSCHGQRCECLGAIPDCSRFAGTFLSHALPGGALYRCVRCELWFRYPRLSMASLNRLYALSDAQIWVDSDQQRADWARAEDVLKRLLPCGRVLDVGCHDGALLQRLGARYERFGVELNPAAAARARTRGIEILASDFHQLPAEAPRFDAILATDVIEHMPDPLEFIRACARRVAPGGVIVISTGCTDAWTWRWMKSAYWYCANPEHLSFVGEAWIRRVQRELSLELLALERFSHDGARGRALSQTLINLAYQFAPGALALARRRFARDPNTRARADLCRLPPSWSTAKDHVLFALRAAR